MKKINQIFNFLDLIEYNEVQKELIEWTKEKGLKADFPNIFEDINTYCNDTRFTLATIYSKNNLRAVWLTSLDSDSVEEERKRITDFELSIEIWFAEEKEPDDEDDYFDYDFVGKYVRLKAEEVIESIRDYLDGKTQIESYIEGLKGEEE